MLNNDSSEKNDSIWIIGLTDSDIVPTRTLDSRESDSNSDSDLDDSDSWNIGLSIVVKKIFFPL